MQGLSLWPRGTCRRKWDPMGHTSRSVDSILQGANDRLGQGTGLGGRFYMLTRLRKTIVWTSLGEESKEPQGQETKFESSVDTKSVY